MLQRLLEKFLQYSRSFNNTINYSNNRRLPQNISSQFFHTDPKANSLMDSSLTTTTIQDNEICLRAHKLCSEHLGGPWATISPFQLTVVPVSGGMSNSLFCCSLPETIEIKDGEPSQILLRFYGDQSRNSDISIQLEIFNLLSMRELGPKLYGKFEDGRLEEFLPAQSLTCDELTNSEISSIIAKKLATVHSLDVPIDRNEIWLLERYNEWIKFIQDEVEVPSLDANNHITRQSTIDIAQKLLAIDFRREIEFMREIFEKSQSPIVFSHNDLHQGNILLSKYSNRRPTLEERLFIIDFEYCSYNYRAYDIANHFCEWCFEYDTPEYPHFTMFENKFPNLDSQYKFVNHYSKQSRKLENLISKSDNNNRTNYNTTNGNGTANSKHYSEIIKRAEGDDMAALEDSLLEEIKPFFMAANLLWTLWCIRSAKNSTIKFGYWEHAMARWKLYSGFKLIYLK